MNTRRFVSVIAVVSDESSMKIFDTAFVRNRGLGFRFQFRPKSQDRKPKPKDQFAYMWNPKGVKIFQPDKTTPTAYSTLDDAMTNIIAATDGTGYNIPKLLLGGVVTGTDITSLTNVSNAGVVLVNGISCFVINGRSKSSEFVTFWVDTHKYLIRKSMVRALLANYVSETTTLFRSDFDVSVSNEELIVRSPL